MRFLAFLLALIIPVLAHAGNSKITTKDGAIIKVVTNDAGSTIEQFDKAGKRPAAALTLSTRVRPCIRFWSRSWHLLAPGSSGATELALARPHQANGFIAFEDIKQQSQRLAARRETFGIARENELRVVARHTQ
jgi:hypothetical protein